MYCALFFFPLNFVCQIPSKKMNEALYSRFPQYGATLGPFVRTPLVKPNHTHAHSDRTRFRGVPKSPERKNVPIPTTSDDDGFSLRISTAKVFNGDFHRRRSSPPLQSQLVLTFCTQFSLFPNPPPPTNSYIGECLPLVCVRALSTPHS